MAVPMANHPPFATLNHFAADLGNPSESHLLRIGISSVFLTFFTVPTTPLLIGATSPLWGISRRPLGPPRPRGAWGAGWAYCADRTCRAWRTGDAGIASIALCPRRTLRPGRPCRPPKPIAAAQAERYH